MAGLGTCSPPPWRRLLLDRPTDSPRRCVPTSSGLAWLAFLSSFGLGSRLADDMGRRCSLLVLETLNPPSHQIAASDPLLLCPMSLVGNWQQGMVIPTCGTPPRGRLAARRGAARPPRAHRPGREHLIPPPPA